MPCTQAPGWRRIVRSPSWQRGQMVRGLPRCASISSRLRHRTKPIASTPKSCASWRAGWACPSTTSSVSGDRPGAVAFHVLMAVGLQQSPSLMPRPVLKLIVEHPVLAPYLHPEAPGRVPLLVSDHLLEPGVTPSRFGQPLRIVPDRELGTEPHLRILSFDVDGSRAKAVVEYRVEGVRIEFDLRSNSHGWWTVADAKVVTKKL